MANVWPVNIMLEFKRGSEPDGMDGLHRGDGGRYVGVYVTSSARRPFQAKVKGQLLGRFATEVDAAVCVRNMETEGRAAAKQWCVTCLGENLLRPPPPHKHLTPRARS